MIEPGIIHKMSVLLADANFGILLRISLSQFAKSRGINNTSNKFFMIIFFPNVVMFVNMKPAMLQQVNKSFFS